MTTHFDDEAQIEQLRRWWKENWLPLASGLVLGLGAIFGWQAWTRYQDGKAGAASHLFEDLRSAVNANKFDDAVPMAERLQKDYAGTPYAVDGALKMAQAAFDNGKLDDAHVRLEWAEQNAHDAAVSGVVRLRLARVLWQQAKPDEALKKLDGADASYAPLYAELRGDILLAKGDRDGARSAYASALQTVAADSPARDGLQQKLDDLAVATVKS